MKKKTKSEQFALKTDSNTRPGTLNELSNTYCRFYQMTLSCKEIHFKFKKKKRNNDFISEEHKNG